MKEKLAQFSDTTPARLLEAFPRSPWEHQAKGLMELLRLSKDYQSLCLCSPTGGGKTLMMAAMSILAESLGMRVAIYTNRRLLTRQMFENFERYKIQHGVRSAAFRSRENMLRAVQISSIATEFRRVLDQKVWHLHDADLVLVDEAHMQASDRCQEVLQKHLASGALLIGVSATPVEVSHIYKRLVVAGTKAELRRCGAHVPAIVKSCTEMDTRKIEKVLLYKAEFGEEDMRECWGQAIVGRVYDEWKIYNPDARQALCFAPGVSESMWLAKEFRGHGVSVAHIDAKDVWVNGELQKDSAEGEVRRQVLDDWDAGRIKVVFNCQVMVEGIDRPSIYHGILARPFGSLKNYVQAVGRFIRRSEATPDNVLITDHGGNYYRHGKYGSPNRDIDWQELFWLSEAAIRKKIDRERKENPEQEPIACPECGTLRTSGNQCPICGTRSEKRVRRIVQLNGQIVDVEAAPAANVDNVQLSQKRWDKLYWSAKKKKGDGGMTFRQMREIYKKTYNSYPPKNLKNMPLDDLDWARRVKDKVRVKL